jgi:hypothetical protein
MKVIKAATVDVDMKDLPDLQKDSPSYLFWTKLTETPPSKIWGQHIQSKWKY